ncbi:MAG: amidohydrolase family protein [Pseudomonadota bacterium]
MARRPFTVVRGGRLVDGEGRRGEFADILIAGDSISDIGPPGLAAPADADAVDAAGTLLIPGLVNAHTHGEVSLAKGFSDRWTLELLLNATPLTRERFRLEDKCLAAKLAAVEMVLHGSTACYDLFAEFPAPTPEGLAAVGRGYAEVGVRAVVAPLMADRSFWRAIPGLFGALPQPLQAALDRVAAAPAEASLAACRKALKDWPMPRDRVRLALAPTIPHHCEDSFFRACRRLADEFGVGIHSHLGESKAQAVVGKAKYGMTLAAHLDELGVFGPDFTAAHAVWVDDDDIRRLADRGASVAHNPTSNLRLGAGVAPVRAMLDAWLNVGIGTDASTCSDGLNMFEAMRLACYLSRLCSPDPARWLGAEQVLAMATRGSARALGMDDLIGRLAIGFKADIVFLDLKKIQYLPLNDAARQVVFQETGAGVRDVMIGGEFVVRNGVPLRVDYERLRRDVEALNDRLRPERAEAERLVRRLEPIVGEFCTALAQQPYHVHRYVGGERAEL